MVKETDRAAKERAANELLREHHALGKRHGIYTDAQIRQQRIERGDSPLYEERTRAESQRYIGEVLWYSLQASLNRQHFPDRAIRCMFYWSQGMTYKQIGDIPEIALERHAVSCNVHKALLLLRGDSSLGLYQVLCEVFRLRADILRGLLQ